MVLSSITKNFKWEDYFSEREKLMKSFPKKANVRHEYMDSYYPYPFILKDKEINEITNMGNFISTLVKTCVENYFEDERISKSVSLSEKVYSQLKNLKHIPYQIGFIRPDFLYDSSGVPKICEINGRFILNGLISSVYANGIFPNMDINLNGLEGLLRLEHKLEDDFNQKEISIVKGREEGYDIHLLFAENRNHKFFSLNSLENVLANNSGKIILELHQDEIEDKIDLVCKYIHKGGEVLNDPRTLFIAHDKRLLSVLTDMKIMGDYFDKEELNFLKKHIIKTYVSSLHKRKMEEIVNEKNKWIAKKGISGKSDGLVIGSQVNSRKWKSILRKPDFVLQENINQKKHNLWNPYFRRLEEFNLVGTIPIIDDKSFGPAMYRIFSPDNKFFRFGQPVKEK